MNNSSDGESLFFGKFSTRFREDRHWTQNYDDYFNTPCAEIVINTFFKPKLYIDIPSKSFIKLKILKGK